MYEWLLVLHVLSAFALGGGLVAFWALTVASRGGTTELMGTLARPFGALTGAGAGLVLVFGVWLALYLDEYEIWDWWILASLALWAVSAAAGQQTGEAMTRAAEGGPHAATQRRRGVLLHGLASLAVLGILALMIFKPGA